MWVGLIAGAAIGFKLLLSTLENIEWGTRSHAVLQVPRGVIALYPLLGFAVALGALLWVLLWLCSGSAPLVYRAPIVLAGFAIGFIIYRSRLCFSRVFVSPLSPARAR